MDWLSQIVFHPTIPEGKISKERNIIFQENFNNRGWLLDIFNSLGFGYDLYYTLERMIFPNNPLSLKVIGDDKSLEKIDRRMLVDWYRKYYLPNNSALIVVGGVTCEDVYRKALHYFGGLEEGQIPSSPRTPPFPGKNRKKAIIRGPMDTDNCRLVMGFRTPGYTSADYWPLIVLAEYLEQILREEIRIKRGLAYYLWAYNVSYTDAGYFCVHARSREKDVRKIKTIAEEVLNKVSSGNIDLERLEEAKNAVKGRWILSMENNFSRARWINKWIHARHTNTSIPDYEMLVEGVTSDDLQHVVQKYRTANLSFTVEHIPIITVAKGAKALGILIIVAFSIVIFKRLRG